MTRRGLLLPFALLALAWPGPVPAQSQAPAPAPFRYLGPVETLDNGVVTLQVAPQAGRIVAYHRRGEPNWLTAFDVPPLAAWHWNPWGGGHLWPTAQFLNPQIYKNQGFDPVIDGQPWTVTQKTGTSLEMRSGVSPQLGMRVVHHIELARDSSEVVHTYRFEQVGAGAFPVHAWAIAGVHAGDCVLMECDPTVPQAGSQPYRQWTDISREAPAAALVPGTHVLKVTAPKGQLKLGTYGTWIAQVRGASAFQQAIRYDPAQPYLESASLETFFDSALGLYEIETLGPAWFLRKGETASWRVTWRLLDLPPGAATDAAKAAFLSSTAKP